MLNDQLKNQILPWQKKGRWYKAFVESTGSAHKLTLCDLEGCSISGSNLFMPDGFHIVDYNFGDNDIAPSQGLQKYVFHSGSNGKEYVTIPTAANYTHLEIFFYAYKQDV